MTGGRPLRFLAIVLLGWTSLRAVALWPEGEPPGPAALVGVAEAVPVERPLRPRPGRVVAVQVVPAPVRLGHAPRHRLPIVPRAASPTAVPAAGSPPLGGHVPAAPAIPPPVAPPPLALPPKRWAVSAWAIARGGNASALLGGQLGASQTGLRATYMIDRRRRLALSARLAAPLSGRGREAGLGIDWQPTALPLHVIAEQRIALDGGRSGPALLVVGGIAPTRVAGPIELEGYAQGGAVARGRVEPFADGSARLTLPLVERAGWRLDIGAGAWAGGQRGAARADIGPTLGLAVPVAGRRLRLTADWRERVAGRARPGSGPALSLGTDF
ncbi:hypothetical protein GGQ80_000159 [Sphingomonas jinjuensis]|uniref:Uncharacterized protein n=1 Tax=Sphingomonas jinjuensis TaxID=535907 RepID=A0A840EZ39_9SPHN|nr:hypothetical protein [Sphingomonas jinjuensis]MBB4152283.1 hypothetical protein [Sphingomonas jinjuensis]